MTDDKPASRARTAATSWPSTSPTTTCSPRPIVNRMWGVFLGRGFVNPVDDFNDQNKPSNPELLDELAVRFKNYNYDQKELIRWICNSEAYNLSCVANNDQRLAGQGSAVQPDGAQVDESRAAVRVADRGDEGRGRRDKDAKKDAKDKWLEHADRQLRRRRGQRGQLQRHRRAGAADDERRRHQRGHRAGPTRAPWRWPSRSTATSRRP